MANAKPSTPVHLQFDQVAEAGPSLPKATNCLLLHATLRRLSRPSIAVSPATLRKVQPEPILRLRRRGNEVIIAPVADRAVRVPMQRSPFAIIVGVMISTATEASADVVRPAELPECGQMYAPPFWDGPNPGRRTCLSERARSYRSRYSGIAKQALDLESQACAVPDASYRLLDQIVDEVRARARRAGYAPNADRRRFMERISEITGDVLADMHFHLKIPTETLGDALEFRSAPSHPARHIIDCDTSSLILLEVAQSYGMPASLVDITLPSGSGHNYVRWHVNGANFFDWDTNGRGVCTTPSGLPSFEGRSLTRDETMAYLTTLRAAVWKEQSHFERALEDYQEAVRLDPARPMPFNNVAWMIATREFRGREAKKGFAVASARRALTLHPTANYRDTLGCALALNGEFEEAIVVQQQAVAEDPDNGGFADRLAMFKEPSPRDCTGLD
jgi:tetratricopeptide (TPR) repeat protein